MLPAETFYSIRLTLMILKDKNFLVVHLAYKEKPIILDCFSLQMKISFLKEMKNKYVSTSIKILTLSTKKYMVIFHTQVFAYYTPNTCNICASQRKIISRAE